MRMLIVIAVAACMQCVGASAQVISAPVNNVTEKQHIPNRTPTPYAFVREGDIMWEKWVWRTIDMREKMNHKFYFPFEPTNNRANLLTIIQYGIANNLLTPYGNDGFEMPMDKTAALNIGTYIDSLQVPDLYNPDILRDTVIVNKLDPKDVLEYRVKEIWFFDRQRSMMDVRIVGICPVRLVVDRVTGEIKGKEELYWIYFPHLRNVLVNYQAFNRFNDTGPLSYDDVFIKRMFSSYAYKESNVYDRRISEYAAGMDGMLESERIKTNIMDFEHDLWDW